MIRHVKKTQHHDKRRSPLLRWAAHHHRITAHDRLLVHVTQKAASYDGIGHENDGLPGRKPAHVAEYQLEAFPDEPEEQHVDVLQVIPHPYDLASACSNSHHFENPEQTRPEPKRRLTNACLNFIHLDTDTRNTRGKIIWHALSQTNHSPVLVLEQRLVTLRLRLREIALRAVHLGLDIIPARDSSRWSQ